MIWERNKLVIHEIPWFKDIDRPSREYYRWRLRLYTKWHILLFGEEPQE
jgi:hypothetical protein